MSNELKKLFEENPKAKEEFDIIVDILNTGSVAHIKELLSYIEELESMVEENASREEMLQTIDCHNHYTERMQYEGLLEDDETWWEGILEGWL